MAEEVLNAPDVDAAFEQVGGKRVSDAFPQQGAVVVFESDGLVGKPEPVE